MVFRKDDHQAMQPMYHFKVKANGKDENDLLDLVREIPISELPVPIRNKR
jgi:branched-chain amino acid transport system substrate-binding protein